MSILKVRLRKSSSDWQMTRAVFEEELRAIDRALNVPLKRIRVPTQDEFAAHLLEVHCMWCEACPPPGGHGVRIDAAAADGSSAALSPQKRKIYVSTSTQTTTYGIDGKLPMDQDTHERWQSLAKKVGVTARQLAGVLLDAVDEGKLGLTVNVESRLLMDSQGTLDDDDDEDVDEDDENVSETFLPLSMTCHGDDKEPQADVNRSPESPSSERVICANFIKEEVLEDDLHVHADQWPDRGIKQEDNDNGSNTEKDKKQRENDEDEGWLEDCGPSSLQDSIPQTCTHENFYDMQSHFERTNQVSDILIKQERDHCDECMDSSRNESTSSQRITDDLSADGYDVQSHLEKINQVSDLFIKHEGDHCNVDMDSRRNESASCQRPEDRIQTNRSVARNIPTKVIFLTNRGHSLERSVFPCSVCNKVFPSNDNLASHMKTHPGEKQNQCVICFKRFFHKGDQEIYDISHKGEKPYQCTSCDKRYSQKIDLLRHVCSHSG